MKKIITVFAILGLSSNAYSQAVFDLSNNRVNDTLKLKHGKIVTLEVQNVNKFASEVEIDTKIVSYVSVPSASFATLFGIEKKANEDSISDATKAMSAIVANKIKKNEIDNLKQSLEDLVKDCIIYNQAVSNLSSLQKIYSILIHISKIETFNNENVMSDAMKDYKIDELLKKAEIEEDKFEQTYEKAYLSYVKTLQLALKTESVDSSRIKKEAETIRSNYTRLDKGLDTLNLKTYELRKKLLLSDSYIARSIGRVANGDEVEFKVKVNKKDYEPFIFETKGGLKLDYSVGPILSFGKNAQNLVPYFDKKTDSTVTLQSRIPENRLNLGIGSFLHITGRNGKNARMGMLVGIGTELKDLTTIETNLAIGPTIVLGKQTNLISLSAGVNFNRVNRLKTDEYKIGNVYKKDAQSLDNTVEKVFKPSLFFSVTYILPKRKSS
ncbi:hypothetical protein EGI22_12725 [Lacihabitans sp. LS3-19]|uniref:hypothetical protein n=1 Tax=Lacihabitans sp. LS3-19 TaxID=2487335 RepID=UPI0020CEA46F|nr:hypothetical protein [Lacihabitans sp. LS3-19]MCP9768783.1 hypothetical protein [Lacihabitans sp. LS3-19]